MILGCMNKLNDTGRKQEEERRARCRQCLGREGERKRKEQESRSEKVRREGKAMLA